MGPSVAFCFQLYSDSSLEKWLWILLLSFPPLAISGFLLICSALLSCCLTEEPTHMQKTLKNMSEKISLNNHGLDQEWQTNEIRSFLRAQWWWPHALSCLPLAASHKSSSHFLESNQPCSHFAVAINNDRLALSGTALLSLIGIPLQPSMKNCLRSCLICVRGL